jgi:hypothetical protein
MNHKFESDLHADLNAMVHSALRQKQLNEENNQRKQRKEKSVADRVVCDITDMFKMP